MCRAQPIPHQLSRADQGHEWEGHRHENQKSPVSELRYVATLLKCVAQEIWEAQDQHYSDDRPK